MVEFEDSHEKVIFVPAANFMGEYLEEFNALFAEEELVNYLLAEAL